MAILRMSYAEYVAREATSPVKHEYLRGETWPSGDASAMAGGTPEHGRLQVAFASELRQALRAAGRPCNVFSSDVRVRIEARDRTTYPDVLVVCGKVQAATSDANAVVNPLVIVEVLSDSTERNDRGEKFAHYRRLGSLEEYVLVGQGAPRIEVFRRSAEGWVLTEAGPGESIELRSLGVRLAVDAVYADPTA